MILETVRNVRKDFADQFHLRLDNNPDSSHLNQTVSGVGGDCSIPKLQETLRENASMLVCLEVHSHVGREAKFGDMPPEVRRRLEVSA